jgi:hypothetical protein
MKRIRRIGTAVIVAAVMATSLTLGAATVEARGGKKGSIDPHEAICKYLAAIINYDYVNPIIKSYAMSLFTAYACDVALLD